MDSLETLLQNRINNLKNRIAVSENQKQQHAKLTTYIKEGELIKNDLEIEAYKLTSTSKFLSKYRVDKKVMDSNQITNTVTSIVNLIFPEYDYTYFLGGKLNGDHTHTELLFKDSKGFEYVPDISNGNGVQQTASFSCVSVVMALSDTTPTLLLDEQLKSLSPDKAPMLGEVLQQFSEYGFQILIIEHPNEFFENIDYTEICLGNENRETKVMYVRNVKNSEEFEE